MTTSEQSLPAAQELRAPPVGRLDGGAAGGGAFVVRRRVRAGRCARRDHRSHAACLASAVHLFPVARRPHGALRRLGDALHQRPGQAAAFDGKGAAQSWSASAFILRMPRPTPRPVGSASPGPGSVCPKAGRSLAFPRTTYPWRQSPSAIPIPRCRWCRAGIPTFWRRARLMRIESCSGGRLWIGRDLPSFSAVLSDDRHGLD